MKAKIYVRIGSDSTLSETQGDVKTERRSAGAGRFTGGSLSSSGLATRSNRSRHFPCRIPAMRKAIAAAIITVLPLAGFAAHVRGRSHFKSTLLTQGTSDGIRVNTDASGSQASPRMPSIAVLKVHVLLTSDGGDPGGDGSYADRYPETIRVEAAAAFSNRISAYGAAYQIWIAPTDWTGTGAVGGDGSTEVDLHPVRYSTNPRPRLHYENSGGCAGCALDAAAPYFPSAMQSWEELFGYDAPRLPPGLKIDRVSQKLVTYSFFNGQDMLTRGAIYFDSSPPFF